MDEDLQIMYNFAMGGLMEKYAKTHRYFFTQKEFEDNQWEIFEVTAAKRKLIKKLKDVK